MCECTQPNETYYSVKRELLDARPREGLADGGEIERQRESARALSGTLELLQ
jgi:hypothetical protein